MSILSELSKNVNITEEEKEEFYLSFLKMIEEEEEKINKSVFKDSHLFFPFLHGKLLPCHLWQSLDD